MPKKGYKDIKEEVIKKRTNKNFSDWKKILDNFDVKKNSHKAAVNYLIKKYGINHWWAQVIVIRYEYEKNAKRN